MKKLPITAWLSEDRPREKLIEKGKESLSNSELLAILLGSGNRDESAVNLAHRMLKSVDGKISEPREIRIDGTDVHALLKFRPPKSRPFAVSARLAPNGRSFP